MQYTHQDDILVAADPAAVYAVVSDVTRTGEWSPICIGCEWDDGTTGEVGDFFTGHNRTPDREWSTRSQVTAADPGREFGWSVGPGWVEWKYTMRAEGDGTRLTEHWLFGQAGLDRFVELYGDDAPAQIENRIAAAHEGIPATLAALKRIIEAR